ncbi:hypothetical protein [Streptomyces sp. NPDC054837]
MSGIADPAEVDAAFERGEWPLGTAVIALAFNCSLEEASPRIVRATRLPDRDQRWFAFTAVAVAARLNGALTFVPYRDLPPWLKRMRVRLRVQDKLEAWWLSATYATEGLWKAVGGRRSGR